MRKIVLALGLLIGLCGAASAQCNGSFAANTYCGSNAGGAPGPVTAASFPITIALNGLCQTTGAVPIYNLAGTTWQCSTVVGSYAHWGAPGITEPTDFWIIRPSSTAGTILQMQDGKNGNLRTLTASNTGLNLQSLVDTSASGFTYTGWSLDAECQAGTNGACVGMNLQAKANTAWVPGAGGLPGASAVNTFAQSTKGGNVWGSNFVGDCSTTACTSLYGTELDVQNNIAATGQASGIWLVNKNTVVPTAGSAALISATVSNVGFPTAGLYFSTVAGFYPLTTAATLIKSDAATIANGVDLSSLTITTSAFKSTGFNVDGGGTITGLPLSSALIRYAFKSVNFNQTNTDVALTFTLPTGIARYTVNAVRLSSASASISTATAGLFTATGGAGQTIAANQAITVTQTATDTNNNTMFMALTNANTEAYTDTTLQFRLGTPQGSAATADVILIIIPLS